MLVLGRYIDQSVMLILPDGRQVTILVAGMFHLNGRTLVKLGFDAPVDVVIARPEALKNAAGGVK